MLVDYLRKKPEASIAADALFIAAERGHAFVSLISLMELHLPQGERRKRKGIEGEVTAIRELCHRLGIKIVGVSPASQYVALDILRAHYSSLGRNALSDSLILGLGIAMQAYLVTKDDVWFQVSEKAISPEELIKRFS